MKRTLRHLSYIISGAILCVGLDVAAADYLIVDDLPFVGKTTDLGSYLSGIFQLGIGIAVTLAVVMLVVNGIQYMFSDIPGIKVSAKNNLGNIIWGLLLAFSAWLILYTINPHLVQFDLIQSIEDAGNTQLAPPAPPSGAPWASDASERALLVGGNIGINKANCTSVGQKNCTSVTGLSNDVIAKLINLKTRCNCSLTITGGTEHWLHSTHGNKRTVDLSNDAALAAYLGGRGTTCGDRKVKDGVTFVWEDNSCSWAATSPGFAPHWHVPF